MEKLDNKLGALLDDRAAEPGAEALGQAIDEVGSDVNLQYRLRRYRMIGETLRNELPTAIDTGFHAAVMTRIAESEAPVARDTLAGKAAPAPFFGWLTRPVAGLAVAAAVAVLTVTLWQPLDRGETGGDEIASVDPLPHSVPEPRAIPVSARVATPGTRWKVDNPALQQKLNAYLVNHTEYASSMQGIIPQARVAGFDTER